MSCCSSGGCNGTNKFFSRWSKNYAKRFRKKGLEKVQKHLLDGIRSVPLSSAEILDIGCGVGALHLTLLKEGASRATGIDVAAGMVRQAGQMAEELGLRERTSYIVGDFAKTADSLAEADIVTLDKVVCCYENPDDLVDLSLRKTRRVYALSRPKDRFFVQWGFVVQIFFARLFHAAFRPYWHNWARLDELILAGGFTRVYEQNTLLWNVAVYKRI